MTYRSNSKPITGWKAVALLPVAVPLAMIVGLFSTPKKRTPAEVAGYIRDFLDGTGSQWDWDDFVSVPIADPELEAIRREARMVPLPATQSGLAKLENLFASAHAIKVERLRIKK